jgi:diguanylate cyclase (GGDEF)-like protein
LAWDQLVPARDLTAARYGGLLLVGTRAFDVRVTPIGEPPLGWVSVLRDVTEAESVRQVLAAQASSDELTGLGNRRTLLDAGRRLIEESHAAGRPLAAAMVDIDHFKRVNDTHGHQVGDRVIARVAAQVQRRARLGDVQVRFGGEEFLLLMADETVPGAVERMEELRAACAQLRIPARDADAAITVSIGVCGLLPGGDIESLLHAADRALYRAKQEGRDRVRAD